MAAALLLISDTMGALPSSLRRPLLPPIALLHDSACAGLQVMELLISLGGWLVQAPPLGF